MNALLAANGVLGLCLAYLAWREFRQRNRRNARILGVASCVALTLSTGVWLHVLAHGW
ncbi:hypothetical protein [Massilia consociata]|uniref:DUF1294 domain-containing protein n=1 Tax=Massilia consociata TaxID=760117 RepID=A0ABV6FBS3_9BURK